MNTSIHGVRLTTVTPFNYGHLLVQGGVATIPDLIGDRAVAFALCGALGMLSKCPVPPGKDYKGHLASMPWRTSVFQTDNPVLLPPLARRSDLGVEGGYQKSVRAAAMSGNFKEYFTIQEVPSGQVFQGIIVGEDPFALCGEDAICVRLGSNRSGMVRIERADPPKSVRLNAATARLFGRKLEVERFVLDETILTAPMKPSDAAAEMAKWH